ncbi:MAG: hypothetical protein FWE42_04785 [Defluviitaleaceae bacterium]|nr:hypothetical protein [Defluviitaleaceae bacterium]
MVDNFHNPDESTFELISRLRKDAAKDPDHTISPNDVPRPKEYRGTRQQPEQNQNTSPPPLPRRSSDAYPTYPRRAHGTPRPQPRRSQQERPVRTRRTHDVSILKPNDDTPTPASARRSNNTPQPPKHTGESVPPTARRSREASPPPQRRISDTPLPQSQEIPQPARKPPQQVFSKTPKQESSSKLKSTISQSKAALKDNISKIALGSVALLLFGVFIFGVTSLFTRAFGDSAPSNPPTHEPQIYPNYVPSYEENFEDPYTDYYETYDGIENADSVLGNQQDVPDGEISSTVIYDFTQDNIMLAIGPYIEELSYEMGLEFDPYEWEAILQELAQGAYNAYHNILIEGVDWRNNVIAYAEGSFEYNHTSVSSQSTEYADEYEPEEPYDSYEAEAPIQTPPPANTPAPERPRTVTLNLTSYSQGSPNNISTTFVNNQTLIDLFVRDFELRLAVNNPSDFPFSTSATQTWANTITNLYLQGDAQAAEAQLRGSITALERADIVHQNTQPTAHTFPVNLNHFTPAGADYTLPVLHFYHSAVRDWFERNFNNVLHNATPQHYLTGNHAPWFALQAHVNSLSEAAAIDYLIARSVAAAHQLGRSASPWDFS